MKKFFLEFKDFAMRGNVLDMARIESGKCPSWTCGPTASPTP